MMDHGWIKCSVYQTGPTGIVKAVLLCPVDNTGVQREISNTGGNTGDIHVTCTKAEQCV